MKILVTDPLSEEGVKILKERNFSVDVKTKLSGEEIKEIIGEYEALIVRSGTTVTADIIDACKKMKVIGRAGVGVDNVDVDAATKKGIIVMNTPGGNTISTAEHTVSMLLSLNRNIPQACALLKKGEWDRKRFTARELSGKCLGIVGLGRIGVEVAKRVQSFGMRIIAYDPFLSSKRAQQLEIELVDIDELLKRADFLTIHTPLTEETKHLISKKEFSKMKKGVKLLNCARGGIVDEKALYDAIQEGIVAGAALDVFEQEPPKNNPLLALENVIVTPHLGASTEEAQLNVAIEIAEQVADFIEGKGIRNAVNFPCMEGEACRIIEPFVRLAEKMGSLQSQIISGHINKVNIKYGGEVANHEVAPITIALIKGLLSCSLGDSVNYVNASLIARERGITVSETKVLECDQFPNLIKIEVETSKGNSLVAGTLFTSNKPRIIKIDEFYIDTIPEGTILITRNIDSPGIVGKIGTVLGDNGINIAAMNFGRTGPGGESMVALNVDDDISDAVVEKIKQCKNILDAKVVRL
ncbi:MAG: phosphoglycerate dehydrogenase [Candidatus Omnitrophica bacterium]|nr:phosphoglycerate dehydrogenase [Candidatus Omnitrophota bacterium]MBU4477743.1 phosphoglycerate dehydrogenase [Candidatus Omnitrophota bacterium]MCG2703035.1 phosphoglycerate dehydrogenase [Candidatus Omnitrophota bacterium]